MIIDMGLLKCTRTVNLGLVALFNHVWATSNFGRICFGFVKIDGGYFLLKKKIYRHSPEDALSKNMNN